MAPRETAPAAVRVRLWLSVCATLRTRRPQWPGSALTNREDWLVQQRAGVRRNATPSRSVILRCTTGSSGLRSSARRLLRSAGRRQRRAARRKGTPHRLQCNTVERGKAARHEDLPWPVHTTSKGHTVLKGHTHHVERPNTRMTCAKGIMVWFDYGFGPRVLGPGVWVQGLGFEQRGNRLSRGVRTRKPVIPKCAFIFAVLHHINGEARARPSKWRLCCVCERAHSTATALGSFERVSIVTEPRTDQ